MYLTLTPAYGRDYKSKAQIEADWNAGKDFIVTDISSRWDGKPINKEDALRDGIHVVNVRYQKNRKVHVMKFASDLQAKRAAVRAAMVLAGLRPPPE